MLAEKPVIADDSSSLDPSLLEQVGGCGGGRECFFGGVLFPPFDEKAKTTEDRLWAGSARRGAGAGVAVHLAPVVAIHMGDVGRCYK